MTTEQLTQKIMEILEHQAKYEAMCTSEKEQIQKEILDMKEDIKDIKSLTESVHIMAERMESMQKIQEETKIETTKQLEEINKKVNAITSQEYLEYKENKKIIKNNILSAIGGAIGMGILGVIVWFSSNFMKGGN